MEKSLNLLEHQEHDCFMWPEIRDHQVKQLLKVILQKEGVIFIPEKGNIPVQYTYFLNCERDYYDASDEECKNCKHSKRCEYLEELCEILNSYIK